jgi:hypothetical protein
MKRPLLFSLIILLSWISTIVYGQTDSLEKAIIFKKVQNKEINENEFSTLGAKWNQIIHKIGQYPDLPLDQAGNVHYSFIKEFSGVNKEKLFSHVLEWLSINYGIFPAYLYSNPDDGRIVIHNLTNLIPGNSVSYTSIISIKNGKVLIEYINIGYQTYYDGYFNDGIWVPERTVSFGITQVYPVILKKASEWNFDLLLLKSTNDFFKTDSENLSHFIVSYDAYNNF